MSVRNLVHLFEPHSVAVVGASNRPRHVGNVLMRNLLEGGIDAPVMPVNPRYRSVAGVLTYPDIASLPQAPDLAVICSPAATIAATIDALGTRGTRVAIVVHDDLGGQTDADGTPVREAMLAAARRHSMRILGAGSLGVLVPRFGLNASLSHVSALPGKLAFVSQSGAMCTAVLDWARAKGIGFSHAIALGDSDDIDFGDVLDYLASDPDTEAILLYIENIRERRNFMAAARAAARNKPVLAVKAGRATRESDEVEAVTTLSGAQVRADDVFDAALRRAGILRVYDIDELFDAVETLSRARAFRGENLAIIHNGGGAGLMALDELLLGGGQCAPLSEETTRQLAAVLPPSMAAGNPVDVGVNAPGRRYAECLKAVLSDSTVNAALVMHAPTATTRGEEAAQAVIGVARELRAARILTCWVGADAAVQPRKLFADAGLPTYETPSSAVKAFLHVVNFHRNQEMLMQTPPSLPSEFRPDVDAARKLVEEVLADGGSLLSERRAKAVLQAYGISVVPTRIARSMDEVEQVAAEVGYPLALTVLSPDIARKWDVGGVALNLESTEAVRTAAQGMTRRVGERMPQARITGFTLQPMVPRGNARQLIISVITDPLFGPVVLFGEGGRAVEIIRDHAIGLPPLNLPLARELIGRTRIERMLRAYRDRPAADLDALCLTLVKVSQIVVDIPEIVEIDINPLFAGDDGVICIDAHMRIAADVPRTGRLAIRPYPQYLEETVALRDGREVLLRPIRPEDEPAHQTLLGRMTPEDLRFRFFDSVRQLGHLQMARLTQIDYDREMAFIASVSGVDGVNETLGVVRTVTDPDNIAAEFAILVRSDLKGQGLGRMLLSKIIDYCRRQGTREIVGEILSENEDMLRLASRLGFALEADRETGTMRATLPLN